MNVAELDLLLQTLGYPKETVWTHNGEFLWCVMETADGQWEAYYQERGDKFNDAVLPTQSLACDYVLGRLAWSYIVSRRGQLRTPPQQRIRAALGPGAPLESPQVQRLVGGYHPFQPYSYDASGQAQWEAQHLRSAGVDELGGRDLRWSDPKVHPDGFDDPLDRVPVVLQPGTVLDRFGSPLGRLCAPDGTPFAERGLPPDVVGRGYHRYEVRRGVPAWQGRSAPVLGSAGGGVHWMLTTTVLDLVAFESLRELA